MKIYSVEMPDGKAYCVFGYGKRKVANRLQVSEEKVQSGCDMMHTPDISEYRPQQAPERLSDLDVMVNENGEETINFVDSYAQGCTLQALYSLTPMVALRVVDRYMHLSRPLVQELIDALQRWLDTGTFFAT